MCINGIDTVLSIDPLGTLGIGPIDSKDNTVFIRALRDSFGQIQYVTNHNTYFPEDYIYIIVLQGKKHD